MSENRQKYDLSLRSFCTSSMTNKKNKNIKGVERTLSKIG
jgi:hypothetical protein